MMSKLKGWLISRLAIGGLGALLLFAVFWIALLLNHHSTLIPNYEERLAMFKILNRSSRQGGRWLPRQGDNWIF